jgi:hypothetical protein
VIGVLRDLDVLVASLGITLDEAIGQLDVVFASVSQTEGNLTKLSVSISVVPAIAN